MHNVLVWTLFVLKFSVDTFSKVFNKYIKFYLKGVR